MKKLSFEDGNLVLRTLDGKLFWSSHWVDLKGNKGGGYKEIFISGELIQKSDYSEEERIYEL